MRIPLMLPLALWITATSFAAPPTAPAKVSVGVGELGRITVTQSDKKEVGWRSGTAESNLFVDELKAKEGQTRLLIQGKAKGVYYIVLWSQGEIESAVVEVTVGDGVPDVPPGPKPPIPPPTPEEFRVLIVYESEDMAKYPSSQVAAMMSQEVRGYLTDKAKSWAVLDKDVSTATMPKFYQDAMVKAKGKKLPYVVVGDKTFEGELPATIADTLALFKKYGG